VPALYDLQMLGTAAFAVTGVLAVNRRGLDVFGGVVLGTVTSLGGGTIRDLIIRAPVFWLGDTNPPSAGTSKCQGGSPAAIPSRPANTAENMAPKRRLRR
jgi:hypothetical protein